MDSEILTLEVDINDDPMNQKVDAIEERISTLQKNAKNAAEGVRPTTESLPGYNDAFMGKLTNWEKTLTDIVRTRNAMDHAMSSYEREDLNVAYKRKVEIANRSIKDLANSQTLVSELLNSFGPGMSQVFSKGLEGIVSQLSTGIRTTAMSISSEVSRKLTDDEIVDRYMRSGEYGRIVQKLNKTHPDASKVYTPQNMRQYLMANVPMSVPQYMREAITGGSQVPILKQPESYREMLPKSFQKIEPHAERGQARQLGQIFHANETLSTDEISALGRIVRNNRYAADAAVKAGIISKSGQKIYFNHATNHDMMDAMAGFIVDDMTQAAQGERKYGIDNVENPHFWKNIWNKRGNNKVLDGTLEAAYAMHDAFGPWLNPGRFRTRFTPFDAASGNAEYLGRINHSPRKTSRAFAEYTLDMMQNGAQISGMHPIVQDKNGRWTELSRINGPVSAEKSPTGKAITPDDFHTISMNDSLLYKMVMSSPNAKHVGQNGFSDNMFYLKFSDELGDPGLTKERRAELQQQYADLFRNGYKVNGEDYIRTRISKTHAEFMKAAIVDDIGRKAIGMKYARPGDQPLDEATAAKVRKAGLDALSNGGYSNGHSGHFDTFKPFAKTMYNQNNMATEGESLATWLGTTFGFRDNSTTAKMIRQRMDENERQRIMENFGTPNMKVVVGSFGKADMDGSNWISDRVSNKGFQGRTFNGKATYVPINMMDVRARNFQQVEMTEEAQQRVAEINAQAQKDIEEANRTLRGKKLARRLNSIESYRAKNEAYAIAQLGGDWVIPGAGINGNDLRVSKDTDVIEDVNNIKNFKTHLQDDVKSGKITQEQMNEMRSRDYSRDEIFAKTTYDDANTSSRWLSKQVINSSMNAGFRDPRVQQYFDKVFFDELARMDDDQYVRDLLFKGDQSVDLQSEKAQKTISDHIAGMWAQYNEGDRLLPTGAFKFAMAAPNPQSVINNRLKAAGIELTPEQKALELGNNQVISMESLDKQMGIIRFPATKTGNVTVDNVSAEQLIKNGGATRAQIERLAKARGIVDTKGLYFAPNSPILKLLQGEDFDGDLNAYFGLSEGKIPKEAKEFSDVMRIIANASDKEVEQIWGAKPDTPEFNAAWEKQDARKAAQTRQSVAKAGGYDLSNPDDAAAYLVNVPREHAMMGAAERSADMAALYYAGLNDPKMRGNLAQAIKDYESQYDVVSTNMKTDESWKRTNEQAYAADLGLSFSRMFKYANDAIQTTGENDESVRVWNGKSQEYLRDKNVDQLGLPSLFQGSVMGTLMGRMKSRQQGIDPEGGVYTWGQVLDAVKLPEGVSADSEQGKFVQMMRGVRKDFLESKYLVASNQTIDALQEQYEKAVGEIESSIDPTSPEGRALKKERLKAIGAQAFDNFKQYGATERNLANATWTQASLENFAKQNGVSIDQLVGNASFVAVPQETQQTQTIQNTIKPSHKTTDTTGTTSKTLPPEARAPFEKQPGRIAAEMLAQETVEEQAERLLKEAGVRTRHTILNANQRDALIAAVTNEDMNALMALKGVGEKTAPKVMAALQGSRLVKPKVTTSFEMQQPVAAVEVPQFEMQQDATEPEPQTQTDEEMVCGVCGTHFPASLGSCPNAANHPDNKGNKKGKYALSNKHGVVKQKKSSGLIAPQKSIDEILDESDRIFTGDSWESAIKDSSKQSTTVPPVQPPVAPPKLPNVSPVNIPQSQSSQSNPQPTPQPTPPVAPPTVPPVSPPTPPTPSSNLPKPPIQPNNPPSPPNNPPVPPNNSPSPYGGSQPPWGGNNPPPGGPPNNPPINPPNNPPGNPPGNKNSWDAQAAQAYYSQLMGRAQEFSGKLFGEILNYEQKNKGIPKSIIDAKRNDAIAARYEQQIKDFQASSDYQYLTVDQKKNMDMLISPKHGLVAKAGRDFSEKSQYTSAQLVESIGDAASKASGTYDSQLESLNRWDEKINEVAESQKRLLDMSKDGKYSKNLQDQFKKSADEIEQDLTKIQQSRQEIFTSAQTSNQEMFDKQIESLENRRHPGSAVKQQSRAYREQISNIRESLVKKHDSGLISDDAYNNDIERLKKLEKQTSTVSLSMQQAFSSVGKEVTQSISNVVNRFTRQLFQKALTEAKQFVKEFDKSMTSIQMITLKSKDEMSTLGSSLIDKAKELKVSVSEVTQSAETLYRQGLTDEEVNERLDVISKFSKVSGTKIDSATKLITVAMNTGLVSDPQLAADIVTALGDNAATNAAEIEKGIEKAGAAAAADGTTFAQLAAMLTAITSTTQIGGNVAGRTLNTIFGRMNKIGTNELIYDENGNTISGSAVARLLEAQDINQYENGVKKSSYQTLYELSQIWESMSDAEQQQMANAIAGTRQYSNFAAIMQGMAEGKVDEYMQLAEGSEGIVDKKYDVYAQSLEASLANLRSTFDGLVKDLVNNGTLTGIIDTFTSIIQGVDNLTNSFSSLGGVLGGVLPLFLSFMALKAGMSTGNWALMGLGAAGAIGTGIILNNIGNTNTVTAADQARYSITSEAKTITSLEEDIAKAKEYAKRIEEAGGDSSVLSENEQSDFSQIISRLSNSFSSVSNSAINAANGFKNASEIISNVENELDDKKTESTYRAITETAVVVETEMEDAYDTFMNSEKGTKVKPSIYGKDSASSFNGYDFIDAFSDPRTLADFAYSKKWGGETGYDALKSIDLSGNPGAWSVFNANPEKTEYGNISLYPLLLKGIMEQKIINPETGLPYDSVESIYKGLGSEKTNSQTAEAVSKYFKENSKELHEFIDLTFRDANERFLDSYLSELLASMNKNGAFTDSEIEAIKQTVTENILANDFVYGDELKPFVMSELQNLATTIKTNGLRKGVKLYTGRKNIAQNKESDENVPDYYVDKTKQPGEEGYILSREDGEKRLKAYQELIENGFIGEEGYYKLNIGDAESKSLYHSTENKEFAQSAKDRATLFAKDFSAKINKWRNKYGTDLSKYDDYDVQENIAEDKILSDLLSRYGFNYQIRDKNTKELRQGTVYDLLTELKDQSLENIIKTILVYGLENEGGIEEPNLEGQYFIKDKTEQAIDDAKTLMSTSDAKKEHADSFVKQVFNAGITDLQGLIEAGQNGEIENYQNVIKELGLEKYLEGMYSFDNITGEVKSYDESGLAFAKIMAHVAASSNDYANIGENAFISNRQRGQNVLDYLSQYGIYSAEEMTGAGLAVSQIPEELKTILGDQLASVLIANQNATTESSVPEAILQYARLKAENFQYGRTALTDTERAQGLQTLNDLAEEEVLGSKENQGLFDLGIITDYTQGITNGEKYYAALANINNGMSETDAYAQAGITAEQFAQAQRDIDTEIETNSIDLANELADGITDYANAYKNANGTLSQQNSLLDDFRKKAASAAAANKALTNWQSGKVDKNDKSLIASLTGYSNKQINEALAAKDKEPKTEAEKQAKARADDILKRLNNEVSISSTIANNTFSGAMNADTGFMDAIKQQFEGITSGEIEVEGPNIVVGDGTVTYSGDALIEQFGDQMSEQTLALLQAALASGGTAEATIEGEGDEAVVKWTFKPGESDNGGGGGGGGKSHAAKLIEKQKREIDEWKHRLNMATIDEEYYRATGDYSNLKKNWRRQAKINNGMKEAYERQIEEIKTELKTTEEGSDDWYNLKSRLFELEESVESVSKALLDLKVKATELKVALREDKSKRNAHITTIINTEAQEQQLRQQLGDRTAFKQWQALKEQSIKSVETDRAINDKSIKTYQKEMQKYEANSEEWLKLRDKILELEEKNAELDNQALQTRLEINQAILDRISTQYTNVNASSEHAATAAESIGQYYQNNKQYGRYQNALIYQNDQYKEQIKNITEAKDRTQAYMKELEANGKQYSDAWYSARQSVYSYEESLLSLVNTIDANQRAYQQSKIQQLTDQYDTDKSDIDHIQKMYQNQAEIEKLKDNDAGYIDIIKNQRELLSNAIATQTSTLNHLKVIAGSGMITDQQAWEELRNKIKAAEEDVSELTLTYEKLGQTIRKSAFENAKEAFSEIDSRNQHSLKQIQYKETLYQSNGQLQNYGLALEAERTAVNSQKTAVQNYITTLKSLAKEAKEAADVDTYEEITQELMKQEESLSNIDNQLQKIADNIEKNTEKIRQARMAVENLIEKQIKAQIQKQKNQLSAEVDLQNQILNVIKQRYTDEWNIIKTDIEKKKQALNEEKNLINQRLQARKNAQNQEDKEEELAEYQRQLSVISADSSRTKDVKELQRKIEEIQKDLAWQTADQEASAAIEAIDDQINAYGLYVSEQEALLSEKLQDNNNLTNEEQFTQAFSAKDASEFIEAMKLNNKNYEYATPEARQKMEETWESSWKTMRDILDTYWNDPMFKQMITNKDKNSFIDYMKTTDEYRLASDTGKRSLEYRWGETFDAYLNSLVKDYTPEDDTHEILSTVQDMKNWTYTVKFAQSTSSIDLFSLLGISNNTASYNHDSTEWEGADHLTADTAVADYISQYQADLASIESNKLQYAVEWDGFGGIKGSEEDKNYNTNTLYETEDAAKKAATKAIKEQFKAAKADIEETYKNKPDKKEEKLSKLEQNRKDALASIEVTKVSTGSQYGSYLNGGLVDYTGLAMVHGTPSKPEAFLSSVDRENMRALLDALSFVRAPSMNFPTDEMFAGNRTSFGDVNVVINQAEINNDMDINTLAYKVGQAFTREISKQGFNTSNYAF